MNVRSSRYLLSVMLVAALLGLLLGQPRPTVAAESQVSLKDLAYNPARLTVSVGDTVTWTNEETDIPHDVVSGHPSDADSGQRFESALLQPGESFSFTFETAGEYPYFCSIHPSMIATIVVTGSGAGVQPPAAQQSPAQAQEAPGGPPMAPPPLPSNASVVATGLLNPRGFTFAPDGTLVVAEAGSAPAGFQPPANPMDPFFVPGTSRTGRVSRVNLATGERTTIVDGLPSAAQVHGDVLGPAGVAYLGSDLYVAIAAGPVHGWPAYPSGIYKVRPDGTVDLLANLDAFNARNPVTLVPPDDEISNPYDLLAADGALWVTDGNRNQIMRVTPDGAISRLADLSASHPVTTGLARAADGALITAELTVAPFPHGAGRVLRVATDGRVDTIATGTTAATGVAVASDGTIYLTELSDTISTPPFFTPFSGRVARLSGNGQLTTIAGGLMFPTITRIGPDGALYVATFSIGGDGGAGQILRIDPDRAP